MQCLESWACCSDLGLSPLTEGTLALCVNPLAEAIRPGSIIGLHRWHCCQSPGQTVSLDKKMETQLLDCTVEKDLKVAPRTLGSLAPVENVFLTHCLVLVASCT